MDRGAILFLGLIILICAILLPPEVFAADGVYIEQEIKTVKDGQTVETELVKIWIQGDFIRFDSSRQPNYTVIDSKESVIRVVDPNNKVYMEFPVETAKKVEAKEKGFQITQRLEKTGRTKKIGEWDCFEVEVFTEIKLPKGKPFVSVPSVRTFVWLTEAKALNDEKIKDALSQSLKKWISKPTSGGAEIKGLPVQVVTIENVESVGKKNAIETEVTVKDIKVPDIPASTFQIPADYRRLKSQ